MAKTSAAVKNRYNEKAYDRISLTVPKGEKEVVAAHAAKKGESVNGFINRAIRETIARETAAPVPAEE
jgi:predicted HicB family RNase H-like nuclease